MFLECLIVIFFILLIVDRWKRKKFMKLHQQLGNDFPYFPIVGNALKFIGNNEDKMKTFTQLHTQAWKKKQKASSIWIGNTFFVITTNVNQACMILKSAHDKHYIHDISKHFLGNGSVFAPVEIWNRRRKIIVPTFASRHVNNFITVFEAQAKVAAELLETRVGKGNFSCLDYITPYTVDCVCESIFGLNVNVQHQPDNPFSNAFRECSKNIAARLCQPWLHFDAIYKLLPVYARQMRMTRLIHEFIDNLICKKKVLIDEKSDNQEGTKKRDKCNPAAKTFLELMIENSHDDYKGYSEEELREETLVLAVTSTDTTAVATSFVLLLLSQHTDVQEKLYREIREKLPDVDKPLHFEDLLKLKYTKAVIKETLRLYPPIPIVMRYCDKDLELRQQYTMLSVTTVLVTLLRRYRFKPAINFKYDDNNPLRLSFDIVLTHVDNFPVQVEYRDEC